MTISRAMKIAVPARVFAANLCSGRQQRPPDEQPSTFDVGEDKQFMSPLGIFLAREHVGHLPWILRDSGISGYVDDRLFAGERFHVGMIREVDVTLDRGFATSSRE